MSILLRVACVLFAAWPAWATRAAADGPQTLNLAVDGVARTALVYAPPKPTGPGGTLPLVFVWHGHGGGSRQVANTFGIERLWPEAIVVYPQGLPTPGLLTDRAGRLPGWQAATGGQGDRDLHFFDALLAKLKADDPVDPKRIYCTGHSNGAGFTYLLWRMRPEVFAAFAPCAGAAVYARELPPKPAMLLGGRGDPLVKWEWQARMIETVRSNNGCDAAGQSWENGAGTLYPSKTGTPLVTFIHDGGHGIDPAEPPLIVKFFQQNPGR